METVGKKEVKTAEKEYTKRSLMKDAFFMEHKVLADTILESDKKYTISAAKKLINDYLQKEVK